jgi:signal transduction histidine kinase
MSHPLDHDALMHQAVAATILLFGAIVLAAVGLTALTIWKRRALGSIPANAAEAFEIAKKEMANFERLAKAAVERKEALDRERAVRQMAEQDARANQELLSRTRDEKVQLGQNLHDGIIQSLYAAGMTLESARTLLRTDPDEAERRITQSIDNLNAAIRDARACITDLAPARVQAAEFIRTVQTICREFETGPGVRFDIQIDEEAARLLEPTTAGELLQIIREAVSNAVRHGKAANIKVRMHTGEGNVGLLVQDDGGGFEPDPLREGGNGLRNIRDRSARIGAALALWSRPTEGCRVSINVPLPAIASP